MDSLLGEKAFSYFPVKRDYIYLDNCAVAPLSVPAAEAMKTFHELQAAKGFMVFDSLGDVLGVCKSEIAQQMRVFPRDISFMKNTAEGLGLISGGYPISPGDEIISFIQEYPSNHYPWRLLEKKGAHVILLSNTLENAETSPQAWSLEELERKITNKTKIISLSHVQFTNGFSADLSRLGQLCADKGIDLIIDASQSLGIMPVYPEEFSISAVAASGWKWLLGPLGCGILYTSQQFRKKIQPILSGPSLMRQGRDYLNHTWDPHTDARKFEYSTIPYALAWGMASGLREVFSHFSAEKIFSHNQKLISLFLELLEKKGVSPLIFSEKHRSGILSLEVEKAENLRNYLFEKKVVVSVRGKFLRIAPHLYNDGEEMKKVAEYINERME